MPEESVEAVPGRYDLSLGEYCDQLTGEIQERVEHQREILRTMLGPEGTSSRPAYCSLVDCPRRRHMRSLLLETIEVIEDTKRSFKSKRLEVLRRKLIESLKDI